MKKKINISSDKRIHFGRKKDKVIFPVAPIKTKMPSTYISLLSNLKERIRHERLRVVLASNSALVMLYWDIGQCILKKQKEEGWGAKVIDRLSTDLTREFPDMKGFSPRNLKYMRSFAAAWENRTFVQQLAAQIPWFHNCILIDRISSRKEREWYIGQVLANGWSRNILSTQINNNAYARYGKAISNFKTVLPQVDSDLACQIFKDPYIFDFLGTADLRKERESIKDS
ncbi:MAG: DUF1016 N-terminal domain-containing protein [Elusimicrobiota bacterium]